MNDDRLSERLRTATYAMHQQAERSGIMPSLLRGHIERASYCRLMRNLHALYVALEAALNQHADSPQVGPLRLPALFRAAALNDDLDYLCGNGWHGLSVTAAMEGYVAHLQEISTMQPGLLAAHAYVRYLGDLSGGQLLRQRVCRALALPASVGTAFYRFGEDSEVAVLKAQFRAAIDTLPLTTAAADALIAEANAAFARHVQLFEELSDGTGASA